MLPDPVIELVGVAADNLFFSVVGEAESPGDHAADMRGRFEERGAQPFTRSGDCGDDAARGSAVNNDIKVARRCGSG